MNLKEAFRFQNKMTSVSREALRILSMDRNVVKVENTALCHKVNPEAQDETICENSETEYSDRITELAGLVMYLVEEREKLGQAIRKTKSAMDMDFDGETGLNVRRQEAAEVFAHMAEIRSSEEIHPCKGVGYKFNAEGNQVSYRCDLKKVTTINFDRNKIRAFATALHKKADRISAELDKQLVNAAVDYEPPFDVNDSFAAVVQWYIDNH